MWSFCFAQEEHGAFVDGRTLVEGEQKPVDARVEVEWPRWVGWDVAIRDSRTQDVGCE
jgi:hypothetical protein